MFSKYVKLYYLFSKSYYARNINYFKSFISEYYGINDYFVDEFYNHLKRCKKNEVFKKIIGKDIYSLIDYVKNNNNHVDNLKEIISPIDYYNIPFRYINKIVDLLKHLELVSNKCVLNTIVEDVPIYKLNSCVNNDESQYYYIAYKIYLSIGLDNSMDLLSYKYGNIDYKNIYYMFKRIDTLNNKDTSFRDFLFCNKKDSDNLVRRMLDGDYKEIFLNFDYLYNNFSYFKNKLGCKMNRTKLIDLLNERFLSNNIIYPEITSDISNDMINSYYHKYEYSDVSEKFILNSNYDIYNKYLKNKVESSIPSITINKDGYTCETVRASDPRNLILGYHSGNCFRINGEASTLFYSFLKSKHMKILSISNKEYKDFAMMLIMRNGNVLISQGIEISKWINVDRKEIYEICKTAMKELMDYMNSSGDNIVVTIIGASNNNVTNYNSNILPFIVNPILKNDSSFYTGIDNYQCLLDLANNKSINDIKLYEPSKMYKDNTDILERTKLDRPGTINYNNVEKRLISLRFLRFKQGDSNIYNNLINSNEIYTICSSNWYITLFDNGIVDSFLATDDKDIIDEYEKELKKIKK